MPPARAYSGGMADQSITRYLADQGGDADPVETAEWREAFGRLGAGYTIIDTSTPFAIPLRRAFAARERLY